MTASRIRQVLPARRRVNPRVLILAGGVALAACVAIGAVALVTALPHGAVKPVRILTAAELDAREARAGPTGAPLLWVVRKDKAAVYLFGSVHVLRANESWMDRRLFQAFDNAQEAWFEVPDLDKLPPFPGFRQETMASRPVLLNGLSDAEKKQLEIIVNRYGYTLDEVARVRPWAMAAFISYIDITGGGFDTDKGADYTLFRRAKSLNIRTDGFEPPKLHFSYLYELHALHTDAADDGTKLLKNALAAHFGTGNVDDTINVMVKRWKSGDERGLYQILEQDDAEDPRINAILLTKRNQLWLPRIEDMLKGDKTVFITVGAAHMLGPQGLVSQLRSRGYTVTRLDPK